MAEYEVFLVDFNIEENLITILSKSGVLVPFNDFLRENSYNVHGFFNASGQTVVILEKFMKYESNPFKNDGIPVNFDPFRALRR